MEFTNYLYRALRKEEIDEGCILIPKIIESFRKHPRLPISLPFNLGECEEYAVRQHQWDGEGIPDDPTAGISTTPHLERAKKYAREGMIVKIDRSLFERCSIKEYSVNEWLSNRPEDIAVPGDNEVILVNEKGVFPKEIIVELIRVENQKVLN